MKKIIYASVLCLVFISAAFAKTPDYNGNWTLDLKQSKNLPSFYTNIKSHKLAITQDEKVLSVAVEIDAGRSESDKINFKYNLDGSETNTETSIRTPEGLIKVPTVLKAVDVNGKLQITITRRVPMPDGETFTGITIENWELSADGKTLTIHRTDDTPRGKMETEMIFVKN